MRVVKMYFKEPDYYIHGTNALESIVYLDSPISLTISE